MNKTLQEQYNLIKEGKGNKQQFFKSARHIFPDLVTPVNTFEDTVRILKNRGIISEGIGGVVTKGNTPDWHKIFKENITEEAKKIVNAKQNGDKSYTVEYSDGTTKKIAVSNDAWDDLNDKYGKLTETKDYKKGDKVKFTNKTWTVTNTYVDSDGDKFYDIELNGKTHKEVPVTALKEAKEAKAEEKEPTKDVVDMETKGYDYKDKKNYNNVFGQEFLKGFYTEMGDSKNEGKTVEELRAIVAKNLAKDINHYVKDGQFGVKGVGYTTEVPGLGAPKEAKGKHKSSGYGDLKESVLRSQIHLLIKEILAENTLSGKYSEYSNDAITDMIINLSRFEDNKEEIQDLKAELKKRKLNKEALTTENEEEEKIEFEEEGYKINGKNVDMSSLELDNIDTNDYPDFADAYISYAEFEDGTPLNDSELDELNDDGDLVYDRVMSHLFENKK